jgi:hypothetical protein
MKSYAQFKKFDEERQLVYAEVYAPMIPDSQGDFMTAEGIEAIAHDFMKRGNVTKIDTNHDLQENGSYVVESFIARKGDNDFTEGAWVMGVKVLDPQVWKMVKSGQLNGFSMYGKGRRVERVIELEIPDSGMVKGTVDKSEQDDHTHSFKVRFDNDGNFLGGDTGPALVKGAKVDDHTHRITKGTATDEANGHSHRFNFLEAINARETSS